MEEGTSSKRVELSLSGNDNPDGKADTLKDGEVDGLAEMTSVTTMRLASSPPCHGEWGASQNTRPSRIDQRNACAVPLSSSTFEKMSATVLRTWMTTTLPSVSTTLRTFQATSS